MKILLVYILAVLLLLVLASLGLLVYLIGRKRPSSSGKALTEKELSWLARFASLEGKATEWWKENPVEEWRLSSFDGTELVADFIPSKGSHRYVICIHGYDGDRKTMRKYGAVFASWGVNVLLPDDRAHGESGGRWIGMGILDAKDIQRWVETIVEKDPSSSIFLFGVSMGGSTVMMCSGLDLPGNVRFYVEDCGYTSPWEEFSYKMKALHVPVFPLLHLASFFSRLLAGYSFRSFSSQEALSRNTRPFVFIHGKTDSFVPFDMLQKNVEASRSKVRRVLEVEGAGHSLSVTKAEKEYFEVIKSIFDEYMG